MKSRSKKGEKHGDPYLDFKFLTSIEKDNIIIIIIIYKEKIIWVENTVEVVLNKRFL